ncbi:N-acetylmuramoyl-L-alanine amidase-like domain-containing protein [Cerina litoralis]|nr:N-acetylmuramoyl-L-alanine amidase-like domain-containing protein [Cerina litoralis]
MKKLAQDMRIKLMCLFFIAFTGISFSQNVVCSLQDKQAFEKKITQIQGLNNADIGQTMVAVGKTFMGVPYVAKTLEVGATESLVVNLHGLDCTTFVENVLAFSLLLERGKKDFDSYTKILEEIRYKNGKLDGYASRLHYFSEWIANNEAKGLLTNVTKEIGGVPISKGINFMSTHRDLYPFLKDDGNFKKIQASEAVLNNKPLYFLPQDQVAVQEHLIHSGDIIALTTSIDGLDITHTGIATRESDGRIHLLHASTGSMKVEVSQVPLADYLKKIKKNTGIMVARPNL